MSPARLTLGHYANPQVLKYSSIRAQLSNPTHAFLPQSSFLRDENTEEQRPYEENEFLWNQDFRNISCQLFLSTFS